MKSFFSIFKSILVFPYYLIFLYYLKKEQKKNLDKSIFWKEEKRYKWVKKKSSFLLWLSGAKYKLEESEDWDHNALIFYTEETDINIPLFFIKKNNFEEQLPLFFVFDKSFETKTLSHKLLELTNPIFLDKDMKKNEKEISERLKIPRSAFFIISSQTDEKKKFLLTLAKKNYLKIIKIKFSKKDKTFYFDHPIHPKLLMKMAI